MPMDGYPFIHEVDYEVDKVTIGISSFATLIKTHVEIPPENHCLARVGSTMLPRYSRPPIPFYFFSEPSFQPNQYSYRRQPLLILS